MRGWQPELRSGRYGRGCAHEERATALGPGEASYPSGGVRIPGGPLKRKRPTVDVGRQAERGFLSE